MDEAIDAAKFLMSLYPLRAFNDPENFASAMVANFLKYDLAFIRRVVDPVDGLPGKLSFPPTVAEVQAALEEAKKYRFKVRATAQWMLGEHERRRLEAEEKARWDLSEEDLARRKAQVTALLKGNPLPGEPRRQKTPESHLVIPPDEETP